MPQFGGRWDVIGLNLTLIDGTMMSISSVQIGIVKHNNENLQKMSFFNSSDSLDYSVENTKLAINLPVPTSAIMLIDITGFYLATVLLFSLVTVIFRV